MASYKEIFGTNIEVLASDPANPVQGQVWYNSTDNVVKGLAATTAGAWATGGTMNTAREGLTGAGIQTSSLAIGGYSTTFLGNTESYDGASWTELNDLNTARYVLASDGADNTAALAFGGNASPGATAANESWNGTCWTEVNDLNTLRDNLTGFGNDYTASVAAGGGNSPTGITGLTETWNGTCWTEVNDMTTGRRQLAGAGTNTSGLVFGGESPGTLFEAKTESWNGTSWTEVGDLNTARYVLAGAGVDNTSSLAFGGFEPPSSAKTELWDGTSWTETTDLNTSRDGLGGAGTAAAAIAMSGSAPGQTTASEEWTGAGTPLTVTFTDS